MRKNREFFFFLTVIILTFAALLALKFSWERNLSSDLKQVEEKTSSEAEIIDEAKRKEEEEKKREEERRRQEEETRRFIVQYGPCRSIPILMYHHVGDNGNSLYVNKEIFAQQMDYLSQKGYSIVSLDQIVASLKGDFSLPTNPVALTFDDGYRDFYENASPILKSHNFKATLFVITQHLDGENYLTWPQLREMRDSGLVTIGDHTLSHPSLPILSEERLKDEIISAKNILESTLKVGVNVFAYPYGGSSGEAGRILAEGGFVAAVTNRPGLACAKLSYELPRVRVGNSPLSTYGL